MKTTRYLFILSLAALLCVHANAQDQKNTQTSYIGYVYPAGGQQGTSFQVRIGGQRLNGVCGVMVSGEGVQVQLTDYFRKISPLDRRMLADQLQLLKKKSPLNEQELKVQQTINLQLSEYVRQAASESLAEVAVLEVSIAPDAKPGLREIRVMTPRGISNPLPFHIGRLPEVSREAMKISAFQVLGKENLALRKRPASEEEQRITLPCTLNGQIASGEINRYRFEAAKGDRLVMTTLARQLVPYIADAVPGWFQPVLTLRDAKGNEVAYNDDYLFKPDPTILYEVPKSGEYILSIHDAIYRGREDFVYRIDIGETPFITEIFPPGGTAGESIDPQVKGWNLKQAKLKIPDAKRGEGIHLVAADRGDALSNFIPFAMDTLPELIELEPNNGPENAQPVRLPVILNGRIDGSGDRDVFKFTARKGDTIVTEVVARRLDSPLDSLLKITDANGHIIALNDDYSDPGSGVNTHHADSYIMTELPEDGTYFIHLSDTSHKGGSAYTYRLRISPPRPDFALRTVPSHFDLRRNSGKVEVFAIRKDGFDGPIQLQLEQPQNDFTAKPVTLPADQEKITFNIQSNRKNYSGVVPAVITGTAKAGTVNLTRRAVPSEDWMQAFLWRHLVPAQELVIYQYRKETESPGRPLPEKPDISVFFGNFKDLTSDQKKVATRIKQIAALYEDWLLTDELYQETLAGFLDFAKEEDSQEKTASQKK